MRLRLLDLVLGLGLTDTITDDAVRRERILDHWPPASTSAAAGPWVQTRRLGRRSWVQTRRLGLRTCAFALRHHGLEPPTEQLRVSRRLAPGRPGRTSAPMTGGEMVSNLVGSHTLGLSKSAWEATLRVPRVVVLV